MAKKPKVVTIFAKLPKLTAPASLRLATKKTLRDIYKEELKKTRKELQTMEDEANKEDELWDDRDFLSSYHGLEGFAQGLEYAISKLKK